MRIPNAAPNRTDGEASFAQRLQYAPAERPVAPPHRQPPTAVVANTSRPAPRAEDPAPPAAAAAPVTAPPPDGANANLPAMSQQPLAPPTTPGAHAAAPELPAADGNGTGDSPIMRGPATAAAPTTTTAPTVEFGNNVVAVSGGGAAVTGTRPVAAAATGDGRAAGGVAAARQTAATRAAALPASYRSLGKQNVQLVEQARDSVFRQIVVRLDKNGGEMRVRLEPPELGELDLHLVVGNTGDLRLSIATERPELAQLIERDLATLKQTLQASGLNVTHTDVHARSDSSARQQQQAERGFARADAGADEPAPQQLRLGGYISAQGLDYWV